MPRHTRWTLALALLVLVPRIIQAQDKSNISTMEGFTAGSYRSSTGETMQYRLFVPPGYDPAQKYPVILWLHGAAGRGADNVSQLAGGNFPGSHLWTKPEIQQQYHAFVLAPVGVFEGEEDPVVPVARMRKWGKQLREAGGDPKLTEYPSIGHNVWDVAFTEPDLPAWLLAHHTQ